MNTREESENGGELDAAHLDSPCRIEVSTAGKENVERRALHAL